MAGPEAAEPRAYPVDYDIDLDRFLTNQTATRLFSTSGDVHAPVAEHLCRQHGAGLVLDLGGGNGLEAMFDTLGCEDRQQRYRLSRASDEVLYALAESSNEAVLVNWWDHDSAPTRLRALTERLVEVHCDCPVEVAAARFQARSRHPGHLDRLRTPEEHAEGLQRMRETFRGPLRLGEELIRVDTSEPVDADGLVGAVRTVLRADAAAPQPWRP